MRVATPLTDVLPAEALSAEAVPGPWLGVGAEPEGVVHPRSEDEVVATLEWAAAAGVGVLPLGSAQRLQGPWCEGPFLVLSTRHLTGIDIYEPADLTLTARAGTTLGVLDQELRLHRQWLPFDPPEAPDRSLGGLVATGASGPLWMGYGELRNHVLGMRVVLGDGRVLELGGRVVKNVAGFDLLKPMVGSRGRLGVITSVCLRAFPLPATDHALVLRGSTLDELLGVALAVGTAPIMPVSSVLVSPAEALDATAALVVRLHGTEPTVRADRETLERHTGASFDALADRSQLDGIRDMAWLAGAVLSLRVLPSRLPEALAAVEAIDGAGVVVDTYAGSIRVAASTIDAPVAERLRERVEGLGGTLTLVRPDAASPTTLVGVSSTGAPATEELAERLERVFDPGGVMWPRRP